MFSKINKFIYNLSNIFKINNSAILLISYIYLYYEFIDATYIKKYNSQKTYEFIIGYFVIIFLVYNLLSLKNNKNNLNNLNNKKYYSLTSGLIYIIFYSFYNLFNNLVFNKIVEGNTNQDDNQDDNEVLYEDGLIASEDARLETEEENKEAAENMDATKNDSNTGNGSIKTQDGEGDQKEEALQPINDFNGTS